MPEIAEIKEIDGAIWCRVNLKGDDGSIGLYTPKEIEDIRKDERRACAEVCEGDKYLRYDIAAAIRNL